MVTLAVLGAGRIGTVHARNAAAHRLIDLVAIADPVAVTAQTLAAETGARVASVDAVFADKRIDAVIVATPTDTHADLTEQAAAAGKAVFCEKPIDLDTIRVRACLTVVDRAGTTLFVGFNRRFDPSFSTLRDRLRNGEIGTLEILTITSRDPSPPPLAYIARSGGLFRDMMIHDFDMACWLLGETPVEVYATASALVDPAIGAAGDVDTAAVLLKTASGTICQISNSRRAVYGYDQRIEAHGSTGMLLTDNRRATTVVRAGADGYTQDPAEDFFLERYADAYRLELDAFVRCLETGAAAEPGGADGLRALVLADAAVQSVRTGNAVTVGG
ncbi:MAG: inositol 2-dehydrogenase [Alphaproteobacteria bacterium]|nr:inositol 2-dehydrogenase [Alphaproteobacteria bacterium]